MKDQYQSTEALKIRFPPFIDLTTGLEISGDACSITVRKPDNSTETFTAGTSPAVAYDAVIGLWMLDIPIGSYAQGEWLVVATSDGADSNTQRRVLVWGDYVEDIATLLKIGTGRWKVTGNTLNLYDSDNETVLFSFALLDDAGQPSGLRVFERVPNP